MRRGRKKRCWLAGCSCLLLAACGCRITVLPLQPDVMTVWLVPDLPNELRNSAMLHLLRKLPLHWCLL